MRAQRKLSKQLLLVGLALILANCGNKGRSADVQVDMIPEKPIVITSDTSYWWGTQQTKVKAPWFKFRVNIRNSSDLALVIQALHVEVTGVDSTTGQFVTKTADYDPSNFGYTVASGICNYSDFGLFTNGGTASGPTLYNNLPLNIGNVGNADCVGDTTPQSVWFYFGDAPVPTSGSANYHYSVKIKPLGWFGSRVDQQDRFSGSGNGTTQ